MARYILRYGQDSFWWAQHVVWFDPCCSILPGSQRQYDQMRQALNGKKRLISDNAKLYSPNLSGRSTALKQTGWGGTKICWVMVLARGVVHVEMMPATWKVDGEGLATFVEKLPSILRKMLGEDARLPRTVFTDRGTGMYIPLGKIVHKYEEALQHAGFKPYWKDNAGRQSPDMGDLLLHETAVAWFRKRMVALKPEVLPLLETREMWCRRAHQAASYATNEYDVAGLCREFPARLQQCLDEDGERLRK